MATLPIPTGTRTLDSKSQSQGLLLGGAKQYIMLILNPFTRHPTQCTLDNPDATQSKTLD